MHYLIANFSEIAPLFIQHLRLTGITLGFSFLVALPMGLLAVRLKPLQGPILGILGVIYTIPSLSLFVLLIPLLGLGTTPAIVALVAYAQLMLVRNIVVGLTGIDPSIIEAAKGMGMNSWQLFWRVELPLAMPLILAGTRLATISIIGIGTIAAYINAGGLGVLLFEGVNNNNSQEILAGSIAVSALAITANILLRFLEHGAERAVHGEEPEKQRP
jgi:osmoprotectant transport system permease protein